MQTSGAESLKRKRKGHRGEKRQKRKNNKAIITTLKPATINQPWFDIDQQYLKKTLGYRKTRQATIVS